MAMNVGSSSSREMDVMIDINTTPLIDVMLVLIIMLIITIPVQTHAVKLNMPVGNPPPPPTPPEVITVEVDFDGTILWNGAVVQDLAQLERYFRVEAGKAEQAEVHVLPDRRARYDTVAQVLAIAQRNGMQRIGFAGQERFKD